MIEPMTLRNYTDLRLVSRLEDENDAEDKLFGQKPRTKYSACMTQYDDS